ncbi:efflux RND transporter permease subunit [Gayadomonas joobiniege]|uniref:efflux RND transporter permease subunit n=1 Tax=Gayadomonas joobiniege TaxID=1234606 RepID=UPI000369767F|nr:efflux RND transporter permease subunit [Gayadomonas joobiniege]
MNIALQAHRYRKPVLMIIMILLLFGLFSYYNLPAREDPEITIREAIVSTAYPGMSAERVENLITKKIEEEIRQIPQLERVRSTSSTGLSLIHVEIADRYFELENIWQDLRNKVSAARAKLPEGTGPSFVNDDFGDVAIITLALTSDGFSMAQMKDISEHIRDSLYGVEGTNKIELLGIQQERIYIEVANAKLAQLGIAPQQIAAVLQNQNIIRPGGRIETEHRSYTVEPTGNYDSIETIENTLINIPGLSQPLLLKDIATVSRGYIDPPEKIAYYNGERAIVFAISMLSGYNVLEYSPRMKRKIEAVQESLPIGYQLNIATYQADQVNATVDGVSINVLQTLSIVLIVVMIFLGMRTGLIVGSLVPSVMLITLAIMNFYGLSLERMSLATLIIALGLLVDNAIVIAEDFKSRLEQGMDRMQALKTGPSELAIPLLSSSFTTILFFLPLMLAQHVAGEYTRSISLVILISLLTSWVLALTLTPILCFYFLKADNSGNADSALNKLQSFYPNILKFSLRHKKTTLAVSFIALLISVGAMSLVKQQFFPDSDRTQVLVYFDLEPSATGNVTQRSLESVFAWLEGNPDFASVESYAAYVGFGGPRFVLSLTPIDPAAHKGFMVLNVDKLANMDSVIQALQVGLNGQFPQLRARVKRMFLGPSDASEIKIQVKGPDSEVIYQKAQEIKQLLGSVENTIDIRDDWESRVTAIQVEVDQQRARRAGVTSNDIAQTLAAYFSGAQVTEFRQQDTIIPVIYRATEAERTNIDRLRTTSVYASKQNTYVPLMQIADFSSESHFSQIHRENLFKTVSIEARNLSITAEDLKSVIDEELQSLAADLPANHWVEYDGVIEESAEAQQALAANMPLVLAGVLVLLVIQFNSFRRPLIIVITIPLAFIGAVVGLLVMQAPFGFMVSLGLYSLAGIIINNAIVLIDRIDILRKQGEDIHSAVYNACLSRLRPVCMTTVTTVLGLLPLIIAHDPLFYGLASVLAFGLGIGTLLTLCVVPAVYLLLFKADTNQGASA